MTFALTRLFLQVPRTVLLMGITLISGCSWLRDAGDQPTPWQDLNLFADTPVWVWLDSIFNQEPPRGLLIETDDGPVPAAVTGVYQRADSSRCPKLNNFWCIKSPQDGPRWEGQIGVDRHGHAIFSDPVYSARAFSRILRSYHYRHDIRSVNGIIQRYAPAHDCIGSLRTCAQGKNMTGAYSTAVASSLEINPNSDLGLFDELGRVHYDHMMTIMTTMAKWEMGQNYRVDEALIREGMVMEVDDFRQADPRRWPGVLPRAFHQ